MIARIRKLDDTDFPILESIQHYNAKIVLEELQSKDRESDDIYVAYGIFIDSDILIGFCSVSNYEEFNSYEDWDDNSRAISELYIIDQYKNNLEIYCDLFYYIFNDDINANCKIFYDNNIDLPFDYYDQLGFIKLADGTLEKVPYDNNETIKEEVII